MKNKSVTFLSIILISSLFVLYTSCSGLLTTVYNDVQLQQEEEAAAPALYIDSVASMTVYDVDNPTLAVSTTNLTDPSVTWSSSNKDIATIDGNGNVTIVDHTTLSSQTITFTAESVEDNSLSDTIEFTVKNVWVGTWTGSDGTIITVKDNNTADWYLDNTYATYATGEGFSIDGTSMTWEYLGERNSAFDSPSMWYSIGNVYSVDNADQITVTSNVKGVITYERQP